MEPKAYGKEQREYTFRGKTKASPEAVYGVLADLNSHLEWGGRRQYKMFRLLSVDAPNGESQVGTRFSSVGTIPMLKARWENDNTVTTASRPSVFEVTTEGRISWKKRPHGEGTFVNRFEIQPDGSGSRVTYTSRQLRFREPPFGLRYPLMRSVTANVWVPIWYKRGFHKMLKLAEEQSRAKV